MQPTGTRCSVGGALHAKQNEILFFFVAYCDLSNCNYSLPFHGMLIGSFICFKSFFIKHIQSHTDALLYILDFPFSVAFSIFVYGSNHVVLQACIAKVYAHVRRCGRTGVPYLI